CLLDNAVRRRRPRSGSDRAADLAHDRIRDTQGLVDEAEQFLLIEWRLLHPAWILAVVIVLRVIVDSIEFVVTGGGGMVRPPPLILPRIPPRLSAGAKLAG